MNTPLKYNLKTESLVLRACRADLTSRNGFSWKSKHVKAPDWSSAPQCGSGLHGWLNGQGHPDVWEHRDDDKWLILAVKTSTVVDLGGKVKFPAARALYVGSKVETASLLASILPGVPVMFANLTGGHYSTLTGGDGSTLTGGDRSTLTGGECSTLQVKWWDHVASRERIATAYVGEDGIEANTAYKLDDNHQFIKACSKTIPAGENVAKPKSR